MDAVLLSSHQQRNSQQKFIKLVSPSMTAQGLNSLAAPVMLSTCVVSVSSLTSNINKPVFTSSPQLLPQVLSPVFLISGQNTATIPPPPPLASCPRFDTPVTLLPVHFTSEVPPPPRLQLCSMPQVPQPPPLFLAGSILPTCSQTISLLSQPPTLQSCPPLLSSKPATFHPTVTTSSQLKLVTAINKNSAAEIPAIIPSQVHNKTGPLAATALQTPLVTPSSQSSSSQTDVFVKYIENEGYVHKDIMPEISPVGNQASDSVRSAQASDNVHSAQASDNVRSAQASDNVRSAVRDLVHKRVKVSSSRALKDLIHNRVRVSSSSSSDIDDYPPVIFGPVSEPENAVRLEAPHFNIFDRDQPSNFPKSNQPESLLQPEYQLHSSGKTSRMIKDILSRPTVGDTRPRLPFSLPTSWNDSSVLNSHNLGNPLFSSHIETQSNNQLPNVPPSLFSKHNHGEAVTMAISDTESIIQHPNIHSNNCSSQSQSNFDIFHPTRDIVTVPENMPNVTSHSCPEVNNSKEITLTRKKFLSSIRMLQTSFTIMMKIFRHLSIPDLLRASSVCKMWHTLGMQSCLWKRLRLEGVRVKNWKAATQFFNKVGVRSLNLKGANFETSRDFPSADLWDIIKKTIPSVTCLEELFFDQIPVTVLDAITEKMPHLINIGAESIIDNGCFFESPMLSTAKTVESMSHAVEAVTSGKMSTNNAARLFRVSEKDLIHLTQKTDKLTSEEETAVLLSCLRLSRMGFSIQKDIVISKCQEMFARRYLSTSPVPISDEYCKDLYHRNLPLFMSESDIKYSDTVHERLDLHYSALRRLYNSLWPRTTLSASQVLVFDLKSFHLDKEPGLNSFRSVAITVLSIINACAYPLPLMTVWPKLVEATHPDLINVMSKRGIPTFVHVFQYFQKILSLIRERPLVILCNGNASLLSEKLISNCVSDSVYLYCVPPEIAKYAFPGSHGGILHILKTKVPDGGLKCGDFATKLLSLLKLKRKSTRHSTKMAFTTTGAFPLNSKAPVQFQAMHLNALPLQSFPWRKNYTVSEQQNSKSTNVDDVIIDELMIENSDVPDVCACMCDACSKSTENPEVKEGKAEQDPVQQDAASDKTKPELILNTVQAATRTRKKRNKKLNLAQTLSKKATNQTGVEQSNSHIHPLKTMSSSTSADNNVCDVDSEIMHSDDKNGQQSTVHQPVSEVPTVEKLVDHTAETLIQIDVAPNLESTESEMNTNLTCEKTLEDISGNSETSQTTQLSTISSNIDRNNTANRQLVNHIVSDNEPSPVLVENIEQSLNIFNHIDEEYTPDAMEIDDGILLNTDDGSDKKKEEVGSSLLNEVSSSDHDNYKEGTSRKNVNSKRLLSADQVKDVDKDSITNAVKQKQTKKKKDKKYLTTQNMLESSHADDASEMSKTTAISADISSSSDCQDNLNNCNSDKEKIDTQNKNFQLLGQQSLIDHDYIIKCERPSSKHDDSFVSQVAFGLPESCKAYTDQIDETPEECVSGDVSAINHEDVIHDVVSVDIAETLVGPENDDNTEDTNSNKVSENSITSGSSSPNDMSASKEDNDTADENSSDYTDSANEDVSSSDSDSKQPTSDLEEDEEEDDDSKCQMCMRSTPPHCKEKIINWIDCDGNCGRWFHVICVARSNSKAGAKNFICPSCRCKR